jgi:hypothetical protein
MRNDPVLPAAVITRQHTADGDEYFRAVTWELEPSERLLVGRFGSLQDANAAVPYRATRPVVADPRETWEDFKRRDEEQSIELARRQSEREKLYGP